MNFHRKLNSIKGKSEMFGNHKIALIESAEERKPYNLSRFHSNRVSALNKSTVDFLKSKHAFKLGESFITNIKSRYRLFRKNREITILPC